MKEQDFLMLSHVERVRSLADRPAQQIATQSTLVAAIGRCAGARLLLVASDPSVTGGAIGIDEALELRQLIKRAQRESMPMVLIIDSAGARVSEGVAVQGALRPLFADLLAARAGGLLVVAVLGRNVFGGASMLAMSCDVRLYGPRTRLAMTGPAMLQSHNEVPASSVADTIAAAHRLEYDRYGFVIEDDGILPARLLPDALAKTLARRTPDFEMWLGAQEADLRARLADAPVRVADRIERNPEGNIVRLRGPRAVGTEGVMQLVDALHAIPTAADAVMLDCEWAGHSMALADEARLLSQYLAYLCSVLQAIEARGTRVRLRIAGELSGGLYIALAGACSEVRLAASGHVLTLPQYVLDTFVQLPAAPEPDADTLIRYGIADAVAH